MLLPPGVATLQQGKAHSAAQDAPAAAAAAAAPAEASSCAPRALSTQRSCSSLSSRQEGADSADSAACGGGGCRKRKAVSEPGCCPSSSYSDSSYSDCHAAPHARRARTPDAAQRHPSGQQATAHSQHLAAAWVAAAAAAPPRAPGQPPSQLPRALALQLVSSLVRGGTPLQVAAAPPAAGSAGGSLHQYAYAVPLGSRRHGQVVRVWVEEVEEGEEGA